MNEGDKFARFYCLVQTSRDSVTDLSFVPFAKKIQFFKPLQSITGNHCWWVEGDQCALVGLFMVAQLAIASLQQIKV